MGVRTYVRIYIHIRTLYLNIQYCTFCMYLHTVLMYVHLCYVAHMLGIHDLIIAYYHSIGVHTIKIWKGKLLLLCLGL